MSSIATFEIHHTGYLDLKGVLAEGAPAFAADGEQMLALYRAMVGLRLFDQKSIALQRTGQLGTFPSSLGQEAAMVGIGAAMQPGDVFFPTYREHGVYLMRGVTMTELFAYWGGDERGMDFAAQRQDFPISIPIATQVPHAVGAAYAMKLRHEARAAVPVCGDGATSKGDFYEALNAAGVMQLPCVFAVINNQWAISVPLKAQTRCQTLAQKAIAAGIPGEQVDGDDVIAVKACFETALARARSGGGPTLIEALTYRMSDHTTADDASRYRRKEELEQHRANDPIARLRAFLAARHGWDDDREQRLLDELTGEVEAAVQSYLDMPPREPATMFDKLYASLPDTYREQVDDCVGRWSRRG